MLTLGQGHWGFAFRITHLFKKVVENGISHSLLHSVIYYRIQAILCACRVGFDGKLEEGGTRLEHFVT
jgi:hypothetical protein